MRTKNIFNVGNIKKKIFFLTQDQNWSDGKGLSFIIIGDLNITLEIAAVLHGNLGYAQCARFLCSVNIQKGSTFIAIWNVGGTA